MWQKIGVFTRGDEQTVNKYMKKYITLLVITEMKMKTTIKYYYRPTRKAKIKNTVITSNASKDTEKLDDLYNTSWNVK